MTLVLIGGAAGGGAEVEQVSVADSTKVVARVGSSVLTLEDYNMMLDIYASGGSKSNINPLELIDAWIEQEILYEEAKSTGLEEQDTVRLALEKLRFAYEMQRKNLLTQAWLAEETKKIKVSRKELEGYFLAHKEEFLYEVKISQILVADPVLAKGIYSELRAGADFRKLAEQYTLDSLKGNPTPYISWYSGYLPLSVTQAIFALKIGQFTQPLNIAGSWSLIGIFKLEDKVKVRKDLSFDEVSSLIESKLVGERAEKAIEARVDSLKNAARSSVEIYLEQIPQ